MRFHRAMLVALALALPAALAQAAGVRLIDVPGDAGGPALHGAMWSPCAAPPGDIRLAEITVTGVKDCPIGGVGLPLVVVSHGRGGSFLGHHDTAEALADAGFVVAAISHPGDTGSDMSRSGDLGVMLERPVDIRRLVDFMLAASPAASAIDPERIGVFGFSRGGYTGLVLVGATPDWDAAAARCRGAVLRICDQILAKEYAGQPPASDARIKAAVIADPLTLLFSERSFVSVVAPVQLWRSARGGDGVAPETVDEVDRLLPKAHEYRVVAESGHFAFLAPCGPAATSAVPELCRDAPGFDRAAFHKQLDADVVAFFRDRLAAK